MNPKLIPATVLVWFCGALVLLVGLGPGARAAELRLEARLVWGTDDPKPPEGKNYNPVGPEISKKLKELPLKWANYFEVSRRSFGVPPAATKREPVSEKCELVVRNLGNSMVEVSLIGKGKEVMKRSQALPKGEMLVLGGNAPNSTAWLVILKRIE